MSDTADIEIPTERMTVEQFWEWNLAQITGRFELEDGYIVRSQAENNRHNLAKIAVLIAMRAGVREAGLDCTVLGDGCSVRIDDYTVYEPDVTMQCGQPVDLDSLEAESPVVLVEVMSKSTSHIDMGRKMTGYFSRPSVQHYLIVDAKKKLVIHHRRNGEEIATRFVQEGPLTLDPPGVAVEVGAFWEV